MVDRAGGNHAPDRVAVGDGTVQRLEQGHPHTFAWHVAIAAFAKAKELRMVTIGLAGGDGGKMKSSGLVDHCLVVPSSSIHRVQECHVACYHILWDLVHTLLADDRGFATTKGALA
jgi:hypothetical protein